MGFKNLEKLGYSVKEVLVKERTLLGEDIVSRRVVLIEGKDVVLRLSQLGSSRYRVVVVANEDVRDVLENEGLDVSDVGEGTLLASASYGDLASASIALRKLASKLAMVKRSEEL